MAVEAPARKKVRLEDWASIGVLALLALLPLAEIVARRFSVGIPASIPIVLHLTLTITFLGAMLAAREERLLALSTTRFLPDISSGRRSASSPARLRSASASL